MTVNRSGTVQLVKSLPDTLGGMPRCSSAVSKAWNESDSIWKNINIRKYSYFQKCQCKSKKMYNDVHEHS